MEGALEEPFQLPSLREAVSSDTPHPPMQPKLPTGPVAPKATPPLRARAATIAQKESHQPTPDPCPDLGISEVRWLGEIPMGFWTPLPIPPCI